MTDTVLSVTGRWKSSVLSQFSSIAATITLFCFCSGC